jgi:RHS repeat-associated protein
LGQGGAPIAHSHNDADHVGLLSADAAGRFSPNDGNAMGSYIERYVYDSVGNFLQMQHRGSDPAHPGWTRRYMYNETSLIEAGKQSNRLSSTQVGNGIASPPETYQHDAHGNMLRMPHLGGGLPGPNMHWDYKDQLRQADLGGGGAAFYVYDASGQRVRKVWEKSPGLIEERIYLGGFEIFRKHGGPIGANTATLERETLHVMDDKQRIALVESRTLDTAGDDAAPRQLIRYQVGNHLGTASLELDEMGEIISYEEYSPYGSSTYQAVRSQTEAAKRYRYTGKERDEESGLYYHGARYYASSQGRWISPDPIGIADATDAFLYTRNNPVKLTDSTGLYPDGPVLERWVEEFGRRIHEEAKANRQRMGANRERFISNRGTQSDTGLLSQNPANRGERVMQVGNAAMSLVNAFRDPAIRDQSASVASRLDSIIEIAQSEGLLGDIIMTFRRDTIHGTGDTGFRREFQDLRIHPGSGDQIGHFLGAVRAAHSFPSAIAWSQMLAHEFENESHYGGLRQIDSNLSLTSDDYSNFRSGNLDRIPLDTTQFGVSYQDLYLTYFGLKFAEMVDSGRFSTREEAARYLEILLTPVDLDSLPDDAFTHKFSREISDIRGMLTQFSRTQTVEHSAWRESTLRARAEDRERFNEIATDAWSTAPF